MAALRKSRKPAASPRKGAAALPRDPRTRAIAALLRVAHNVGWQRTTLDAIATDAELGLDELQAMFASRAAMVAGFMADIDHEMLARAGTSDSNDSVRDRLFGVVMARLDVLKAHRGAVVAILRGAMLDPVTAVTLACASRRSLSWMLAAAGIGHAGIDGEVKMQGLSALYASVLWVWSRDESEDMAATMAHLDRQLRRAESLVQVLQRSVKVRGKPSRNPARA